MILWGNFFSCYFSPPTIFACFWDDALVSVNSLFPFSTTGLNSASRQRKIVCWKLVAVWQHCICAELLFISLFDFSPQWWFVTSGKVQSSEDLHQIPSISAFDLLLSLEAVQFLELRVIPVWENCVLSVWTSVKMLCGSHLPLPFLPCHCWMFDFLQLTDKAVKPIIHNHTGFAWMCSTADN